MINERTKTWGTFESTISVTILFSSFEYESFIISYNS